MCQNRTMLFVQCAKIEPSERGNTMYKESFHHKIKQARLEAGYTQQQVTDITGIPRSKISKIESGREEPNIEQLGILIDFYAIKADWIIGTGKN